MSPRRSGVLFDPRFWFQVVLSAVVGAFLMALVLPGLALVRDTTGHDRYAAGKVTAAQAVIASGFDHDAPMQYRTRDGETETLTRYSIADGFEVMGARAGAMTTPRDGPRGRRETARAARRRGVEASGLADPRHGSRHG